MDEKYKRLKNEAESLKSKIDSLIENPPEGGFEEKIALKQFEKLFDLLQDVIEDVKHFSKPVRAGTLRKMKNGKFELVAGNDKVICDFSCGSLIECLVEIDDEVIWDAGRVEYTSKNDQKGYYFYNREAGHPFLHDGMRARIRGAE